MPSVVTSSPGFLAWSGLVEPQVADTPLGLYLDWLVSRPGVAPFVSEVARVDRATGSIDATRRLGGTFAAALTVAGSLWVTTSSGTGLPQAPGTLWRLDPKTLAVRSRQQLRSNADNGSMAVAGGDLWVAAGAWLERVSLPSGRLQTTVAVRGAASSSVAANAAGTVLVVGEAQNSGAGTVERRDPTTGALLATSPPLGGVAAPVVGGVIDGAAWVSEATGMQGYVQKYLLASLTPAVPTCSEGQRTRTCVSGTNGIGAQVVGRLVWLTQAAGGPTRNACLNAATGEMLAAIALPGDDEVLAIAPTHIFIASQPQPGNRQTVTEEPLPGGCRTH